MLPIFKTFSIIVYRTISKSKWSNTIYRILSAIFPPQKWFETLQNAVRRRGDRVLIRLWKKKKERKRKEKEKKGTITNSVQDLRDRYCQQISLIKACERYNGYNFFSLRKKERPPVKDCGCSLRNRFVPRNALLYSCLFRSPFSFTRSFAYRCCAFTGIR